MTQRTRLGDKRGAPQQPAVPGGPCEETAERQRHSTSVEEDGMGAQVLENVSQGKQKTLLLWTIPIVSLFIQ